MAQLSGRIVQQGPIVDLIVMQCQYRVEALKRASREFKAPMIIKALIDTGASRSVLDCSVIRLMDLEQRGEMSVRTPSTGPDPVQRATYDAMFSLRDPHGSSLHKTVQVIEAHIGTLGYLGLIGRDILMDCQFLLNGPLKIFVLSWDQQQPPTA